MNRHLATAIVVPLTTASRPYPTRVSVRFQGETGQAALDQIRAVDRRWLLTTLGRIPKATTDQVAEVQ